MSKIPKGWTPTNIIIRTQNAPHGEGREAFNRPDVAGLVVNRREDLWVVSHVRSGYFIQPGFVVATDACDFALALAPLADWGRTGRELQNDHALRGAVVHLRERMNFGKSIVMIEASIASDLDLGLDA